MYLHIQPLGACVTLLLDASYRACGTKMVNWDPSSLFVRSEPIKRQECSLKRSHSHSLSFKHNILQYYLLPDMHKYFSHIHNQDASFLLVIVVCPIKPIMCTPSKAFTLIFIGHKVFFFALYISILFYHT